MTFPLAVGGTEWVPACQVLEPHDRPAEWSPLALGRPSWCIILPDGTAIINPTAREMMRAVHHFAMPWGDMLMPLQWAAAILRWRAEHPDPYDVPYPM